MYVDVQSFVPQRTDEEKNDLSMPDTDCLFKPRAAIIYMFTKTLFSLEFYGAFYKGLTTKYYNLY